MRIVSLLPSATEILFAVGAGDDVVGVTFECDHPAEARQRTVVSTSTLPEGLDSAGIDAHVAEALSRGEDLYRLDAGALTGLDPDLVVTQDLCAVCAVDLSVVDDALAHLGCRAEVLTTDPHTLDEVLESIIQVGRATGHETEATALVARLRRRLFLVMAEAAFGRPASEDGHRGTPRVAVLEWTDPPYAAGHWVPEMVETAGGRNVLGAPGARSARTTWDDVAAASPDLVVCAPCGHDLAGAAQLAMTVVSAGHVPSGIPVWAVDANASFARPGPRLVDGVEALAGLIRGRESALARRVR